MPLHPTTPLAHHRDTDVLALRRALPCLAVLLLCLIVAPLQAEPTGWSAPETLEDMRGTADPSKIGALCSPDGIFCVGRWSELVDHLFTNANGSSFLYVSPAVEAEIVDKGHCALNQGKFIVLRQLGGDERVLLDQFYLTYAMDSEITLRMGVDAATGECYLQYARTLYSQP